MFIVSLSYCKYNSGLLPLVKGGRGDTEEYNVNCLSMIYGYLKSIGLSFLKCYCLKENIKYCMTNFQAVLGIKVYGVRDVIMTAYSLDRITCY